MMKALYIAFVGLCIACGDQKITGVDSLDILRDTAIFVTETRGDLHIHHYYNYDSLGRIDFETAHVSTYDTITSLLSTRSRVEGSSFQSGNYLIWVPVLTRDTFSAMTESVRQGDFLCLRDTAIVRDALIIERRTQGYGTYENFGFLVVPDAQDTIRIWSLIDKRLPRPIVWSWDGLVPMSLEEYQAHRIALSASDSIILSQRGMADSLIATAKLHRR